jgi:hypothetical protein
MKLRHAESANTTVENQRKAGVFSRMKQKAGSAVLIGAALLLSAASGCRENTLQRPAMQHTGSGGAQAGDTSAQNAPESSVAKLPARTRFAFEENVPAAQPSREYCSGFPELDNWAQKRGIDRFYVRALAITESGLNPGAAAKACRAGYDVPGCFSPGPGKDEGYDVGYDEMHDPAGKAVLPSAPNSGSAQPDWRWLSLGLMQTLEPPYTFWPASQAPDGADGPYHEIYARSGMGNLDLSMAESCNPRFNPFNSNDSACLGTARLDILLRSARAWMASHRAMLNWGPEDAASDEMFAKYIAGHMYSGLWGARNRSSGHPRCSSAVANSECWAYGFSQSAAVSREYCGSDEGQADSARCINGIPARDPPGTCYGYTDFVSFVRDCEMPYLQRQGDPAFSLMSTYIWLRNRCPQ